METALNRASHVDSAARALVGPAIVLTLLATAVLVEAAPAQTPRPEDRGDASACRVLSVRRDSISLGTPQPVYIEPQDVTWNRGWMLVMGLSTFIGHPSQDSARARTSVDSVIGAVRDPNGVWQLVPPPIPGRPSFEFRAAPREPGVWDVVFLELDAPYSVLTSDSARVLWHATLRGTRWTELERVPVPDAPAMHLRKGSSLVRRGDDLAWATSLERDLSGQLLRALLVERVAGAWRWRKLDYQNLRLQLVPRAGAEALLFGYDVLEGVDGQHTALVLRRRDDKLTILAQRRVSGASDIDVVTSNSAGALVTYRQLQPQDDTAWRAIDLQPDGRATSHAFGMRYTGIKALRAGAGGTPSTWIADWRPTDGAPPRLHVLESTGGVVRLVDEIPNPFIGPSPVVRMAEGSWTVIGPAFAPRAGGTWVQSVLLTFGVDCRVKQRAR